MKFQEGYIGSKTECKEFMKKTVTDLFLKKLVVEGKTVKIPSDYELDYKVKYDLEETGGSFSIKVSWDNPVNEGAEILDNNN